MPAPSTSRFSAPASRRCRSETVEAAEALGYNRLGAYLHVILPLAFRISLPALNNNLVNLVKTTTIAYAIAVPEMLYVANQIWSDELNVTEMMNVLLLIYVALVGAAGLRHGALGAGDAHSRLYAMMRASPERRRRAPISPCSSRFGSRRRRASRCRLTSGTASC